MGKKKQNKQKYAVSISRENDDYGARPPIVIEGLSKKAAGIVQKQMPNAARTGDWITTPTIFKIK